MKQSIPLFKIVSFAVLLILMVITVHTAIVTLQIRAVYQHTEHEHTITNQLTTALANAKYQAVVLQESFTDASATGLSDGIVDAKVLKQEILSALQTMATLAPLHKASADTTAEHISAFYKTGLNMVAAYQQSREAGNQVMKALDGFDTQGLAIKEDFNKLSKLITEEQNATVSDVELSIRQTLWLNGLLALVESLLIIFGGRHFYRSIYREIGVDPAEGTEVARRLSEGFMETAINVKPGDSRSMMAMLTLMRNRWTDVATTLRGLARLMLNAARQLNGHLEKPAPMRK